MKNILKVVASLMLTFNLVSAAENNASTKKIDSIKINTINDKQIEIIGTEDGFTIPQYKGKIIFTEFWGTRCPPCLMSIPHYIKLQKKYKDDLAMLAIEVQDKPKEALKEFVKQKGINYDIASYRDGYDFVSYIAKRAGWSGSIPFLLILDQKGKVQIVQPGMIPEEQLEKVIQEMIKANKKVKPTVSKTETNGTK